MTGHQIDPLVNRCCGHPLGLNLDGDRVKGPLPGKIQDVLGEGRGEQQGLAILLARRCPDNTLYLGDKAHIQHTISLVQHQCFYTVEEQVPALHEIDQSPRRRHH